MIKNKWNKIKLKEICNFINGDAYKDTDWSSEGVPIVRIQNLNDERKPFNYWAGSLDDKVTINNSDLLLAWSGTPGTSFGAHIWNRGLALLNQHIFKVIYDDANANPIWLKYAINQILEQMIAKAHGAVGLRHVTKSEVENLEIVLPPLSEQKRIVKIIEAKMKPIEYININIQQQVLTINLLLNSYLKKIFAKKYPLVSLSSICYEDKTIINGSNSSLPFIGLEMIKSVTGVIDLSLQTMNGSSTCYYFDECHILYGKLRPYLNKVSLPHSKGRCSTELVPLLPKEGYTREYIALVLKRQDTVEYVMKEKIGARMPRANMNYLLNMKVPAPSLTEQNLIVKYISHKEKEIEKINELLAKQRALLDVLKTSILRQAFNGEL